jgi:hypothetical protein
MPTTASVTYTGDYLQPAIREDLAVSIAVRLKASTTYPKGCVLGMVTADGTYGPYASGASDGTEDAKLLLKRACITDASGNITFGTATGGMEYGQTHLTADAYAAGFFYTADIPQASTGAIDAAGVTDLGGKIVKGTLADGILKF